MMRFSKAVSIVLYVNFIASVLVQVSQGQACDVAGFYGTNCSDTCSTHCFVNNSCDSVTGSCDQGCKAGYKLALCIEECDEGSYGVNCTETCSKNCAGDVSCDHVFGTCYHGCQDGYAAPLCRNITDETVLPVPESSGSSDKSPWIITGIVLALLLLAVVALVISWRDKLTSCMTNNNCSHSVRRLSRRFRPSRNLRTDTEADDSDNNNYDEVNFKADRCPPTSGKSKHTAAVTAQDQSAKKKSEPVDEDPVQSVYSDVNNESSQPNTHQTHDSVPDRALSRDSEVDNVYIMPDVPQTHDSVPDRALSRESNGSNVYILPDVPQDHGSVPDRPLSRDSEADNVYIMPDVSQNHEYVEDNPQQQDDIPDRPLSHDSVYEQPRSLTITLDDTEELPPDEDQIPQYEDTQSSYEGEEPQCEYMNSSTL